MTKYLVQRGCRVSPIVIANHRKVGITAAEWDEMNLIKKPDLAGRQLRNEWTQKLRTLHELLGRYFEMEVR